MSQYYYPTRSNSQYRHSQGYSPTHSSYHSHHTASPVYYTQSDSGHRRGRSASIHYIPSQSSHHHGTPVHYVTTSRSSRSTSRPAYVDASRHGYPNVTVIPARRSRSQSRSRHSTLHRSRQYSAYDNHLTLGDRIRRLFGLGPSSHHSNRDWHHRVRYTDARTGREVDSNGRPMYRF
ncbi:hypothetical protein JAAARDRAFT_202112 [Jaapia argillacea MUCL 33604]|uniref:Uncharacterized protein n=1 Tax=Jaapia argillacea MUCL 33604 TaxID=933084 RepID=A0A067QMS1_9AGAM|nr:hypothetical protein JAAARDRAFT_202112 [Jaapia argillacea MUCL 33604]